MRVAQPLAQRFAQSGSFARLNAHDRILAGDSGELELVDTHAGVVPGLGKRITEGYHVR